MYDTGWISRSDWTNVILGNLLQYDTSSVAFQIGERVSGVTTGDSGIINYDNGTYLFLSNCTGGGIFLNDEVLTGSWGGSALVNEVSGSRKNVDSITYHFLNTSINNLDIKLFVSYDGNPTNSYEILGGGDNSDYGFQINEEGVVSIRLTTGALGLSYKDGAGNAIIIDTEDWFYKIKIYLEI